MESEVINIKNKKWYKNKKFYIILGIFFIGLIIYNLINKANQEPQYETVKVMKGTLIQTVDATGNVESADELDLRFETVGKITKIYKKVNDEVKAGEIIMSLDLTELGARVSQAQAGLSRSQANLDKLLAGQTDQYLISLESKLDQAAASYEQVKAQYDNYLTEAESVVKTAEVNLNLAEGGEDGQIVKDAYNSIIALLNTVQYVLGNGLTESDNILGIDNTLANDEFEDVLAALDSSKLNQAESRYYTAKSTKYDADEIINQLTVDSSHEKVDWALVVSKDALFDMKNLLFTVSEVLDNTMPIGNLTQSGLTVLKNNIQNVRGSVSLQYSNLINQEQLVNNAKNSFSTYKIAYDKAVANLENLKIKREADLAAAQAIVDQAQASYTDAKNPPRIEDVLSYQAVVKESEANLIQAQANYNKALVRAYVDGVIGKINGKVGQYVTSQDVVAKLISPHFEIKVDIPETDIVKISLHNTATIKLDAYGDEINFTGIVSEIEKGETVIQDVTYYKVTVSLNELSEKEILNGMTADVIFFTAEEKDVIYIPLRTVFNRNDGSKYVRVLEDGKVKEKEIITGLRGDGGLIEVKSGLNEGQEVILSVNE